jgi:antitoxin CcdA
LCDHAHEIVKFMRITAVGKAKRSVNLSIDSALVARARAEGLNLSAIAEDALATVLTQTARQKLTAEIEQACRAHDVYLAEYGSLGEAVRAANDAAE